MTKDMTKTTRYNLRAILVSALAVIVLTVVVAFLSLTTVGRMFVRVITDPQTAVDAYSIKDGYVNQFKLQTALPKE